MSLVRRALLEERYDIVSENFHPFSNDKGEGYTGVFVIGESDATFHTYEEKESLEVTVNTCRGPKSGWIAVARIVEEIAPERGVYAVSGIVPIGESSVSHAENSIEVIRSASSDEFLSEIELKVRECYCEMKARFGDAPYPSDHSASSYT